MKLVKIIFCFSALFMMMFAAQSAVPSRVSVVNPSATINENPTVSKKQQQLEFMKWFVTLTPKKYGEMRGKKLNIFEKASFKLTQYRMKQQLKANRMNEGEGVNWGGLALGFFLGLLGVLGAYIFSTDRNFIKWTWIGCGIWVAIYLLLFVIFRI